MNTPHSTASLAFHWYFRIPLFLVGCVLLGLLVTAAILQPESKGFGTHQQLGLEQCTFITMFGMRCPSCGMTTSWSHTMRLQLWMALKSNSGGTMLALLAMVTGPWLIVSMAFGKWVLVRPHELVVAGIGVAVVVVTLTDWVIRNFVL